VRTLYQRDLAWIHHHAYGRFASDAAPQLLRILRTAGVRKGTLVDLACGSGIWARVAQKAGFDVIGIDRSKGILKIAETVAPGAQFRCASMHDCAIPPCDVVTIIGEGIQYLQPNEARPRPLKPLFQHIASALRPGGLLVFDAIARAAKPINYYHGRAGRDWAVCVEAKQRGNLLVRNIVTFRKEQGTWRRADEIHRAQLLDVDKVTKVLRACGFTVQVGYKYGTLEFAPNRVAFIARRTR
jgi:SAM-dependent methyltransferase